MRHLKYALYAVGFTLTLAGCSSTPMQNADAPAANAATSTAKTAPSTTPAQAAAVSLPPYLDPTNALATKRSIYFDYNDFSVKKDFASTLELHGKYLASHPSVSIKVEGNADERGGTEYNLALGQKRAEAVTRAMEVFGVKKSQVETISWGKEKPKATGHDEKSWAENRRVDLVYPKQ